MSARVLAHLSDLHFGRINPDVLAPLRDALHALEPHLVVISGDLTQRARAGQFRDAREFLDTLPQPQLVVPGNHDVPLYNVVKRFVAPLADYKRLITDDLEPMYLDDAMAVVGVNTARSLTWKGGRINEEQVARIRERLCGLPEDVAKVVVTHHPFDVPDESGEQDQIVGRARMALEKLAHCGADLLLSGHLHASNVEHTAKRYPIAGVSALVVQAGTATSSRTREHPNSFNVLRLDARRIEIESRVWNGTAFAPGERQAFVHDGRGWHDPGAARGH